MNILSFTGNPRVSISGWAETLELSIWLGRDPRVSISSWAGYYKASISGWAEMLEYLWAGRKTIE